MKVIVKLDSPQTHERSHMGSVLNKMLYGRDDLLGMINYTGCPHNGGQHTLTVRGERCDVVAWLDLFQEAYPDIAPETMIIKSRIRTEFLRNVKDEDHVIRIDLNKIERQLPHNGELVSRPWFWTPKWEEE